MNCEICGNIEKRADNGRLGLTFEVTLCNECFNAYNVRMFGSADSLMARERVADLRIQMMLNRQNATNTDLSHLIEPLAKALSEIRAECFRDAKQWFEARQARMQAEA